MTDAISRSAAIEALNQHSYEISRDYDKTVELLNEIPQLDVAPVVHAHWIKTFNGDGFVSTLRCSECGNSENSTYIPGNFCWFCGARMDGEADG